MMREHSRLRDDSDMEGEDEMTMFDQSSLLGASSSSGDGRRPTKRQKLLNTFALFGAFFGTGLALAIPGPTLHYLQCKVDTDLQRISYIFPSRSLGYLFGSVVGGFLFDKLEKRDRLLVSVALILAAISIAAAPFTTSLIVLCFCLSLTSIAMGFLDTGGNVICLRIWGKKSGPYMQALHFAFGVGAFMAPLVAAPFLSNEVSSDCNNTIFAPTTPFVERAANSLHKRELFFTDSTTLTLDHPDRTLTSLLDLTTTADETESTTGSTKLISNATLATTTEPIPQKPGTGAEVSKDQNLKKASGMTDDEKPDSSLKPTISTPTSPTTATTPKTGPAKTAEGLNNSTENSSTTSLTDGSDSITESTTLTMETTKDITSKDTTVNDTDTSSTKGETTTTESEITKETDQNDPSSMPQTTTTLQNPQTTENVMSIVSTTETITTQHTDPVTTSAIDAPVVTKPPTVQNTPTTTTTTTSTTTTTTPTTTTTTPTTTITSTTATTPSTTTNPTTTITPSTKPVETSKPQTTTAVTATFNITKPHDARSPFEAAGDFLQSISKVQFSYLIIAAVMLLFGIVFCCLDSPKCSPTAASSPSGRRKSENDLQEVAEIMMAPSTSYKVKVMGSVFVFFFLYVGTEVAYGQFISTFSIYHNQFSPQAGSFLTSVYWGSFAFARGISVPLSKCLSPTAMIIISIITTIASIIGLTVAMTTTANAGSLWVLTATMGAGMAAIFPTGVLWLEGYIKVTSRMAAVFVCASALGEMVIPAIAGYLIDKTNPVSLLYTTLTCVLGCGVTFVVMHCLAKPRASQYKQISKEAIQMADFEFSDSDQTDSEPILPRNGHRSRKQANSTFS